MLNVLQCAIERPNAVSLNEAFPVLLELRELVSDVNGFYTESG